MGKKIITSFVVALFINQLCQADTFVSKTGKDTFNGYATQQKKGNLNRINTPGGSKFIDLDDYNVEFNTNGRKPKIVVIPIHNAIDLECETRAFEKSILAAVNQGAFCIVIDLDTPGGRVDLAERISSSITAAQKLCPIYAFISGTKNGGAYSAGALIALSCQKIFMSDGAVIGAAALVVQSEGKKTGVKEAYGETVGAKYESAFAAHFASTAESNNKSPLLARAMVDKDTEVVEVAEGSRSLFIDPSQKTAAQLVKKIWNRRGDILTLTAEEALYCCIADGTAGSIEDISAKFGNDQVKIIRNQDVVKARKDFEREEKVVQSLLASFDSKVDQLKILSENFKNAGQPGTKYKEKLRGQLFAKLNAITADCQRIRSISKVYPDLKFDDAEVQKVIDACNFVKDQLNN